MKQRLKRNLSLITSLLTAMSSVTALQGALPANADSSKTYVCDGFDVDYNVTGHWTGGYQVMLTVTNTGTETMENWSLLFDCESPIFYAWNAGLGDRKGDYVVASSMRYNHDIAPGESTVFGFSAVGEPCYPEGFVYVSGPETVRAEDYTVSYEVMQTVGTVQYLNVTVANESEAAIENWKLDFEFPCTVTNAWNARVLSEEGDLHRIGYAENAYIDPASSVTFGMTVDTENPDGLFDCCTLTQVRKYNTAQLGLPMRKTIEDELGDKYRITWQSDSDELPVVSAYPESLEELIHPEIRYSVSQLGVIQFTMPPLKGSAIVETTFAEKPDMLMQLDERRHMLKMLPFQATEDGCTFRLTGSAVVVPLKMVPRTTAAPVETTAPAAETTAAPAIETTAAPVAETTAEVVTETAAATELTSAAPAETTVLTTETTAAVTADETDSDTEAAAHAQYLTADRSYLSGNDRDASSAVTKWFKILSNSGGSFTVDVSEMKRDIEYLWSGCPLSLTAHISQGSTSRSVDVQADGTFSYSGANPGLVKVEIQTNWELDGEVYPGDYCWEQNIYVHHSSSLSATEQNALLRKYAPIVMYADEEEYAPMSLDGIFNAIQNQTSIDELFFSTTFGMEEVPVADLPEFMAYNGNTDYLLDWNDDLFNSGSHSFREIKGSFSNASVYQYYQEDSSYIYLNYYFLYGFDNKNGPCGDHNLDRESMFVVLNKSTKEPLYVVTGGHVPSSNITYDNGFSWTNELVKVDYNKAISPYSEGHPIISVEKYQHCTMPVPGDYTVKTGNLPSQKNPAGMLSDIESSGSLNLSGKNVIFPSNFHSTESALNHYTSLELKVDKMYGNNILNFSGDWVDMLGTDNENFPPFLDRDYDKTAKYSGVSYLDPDVHTKQQKTKCTEEQFCKGYLFTLTSVQDFTYASTGSGGYDLTWEPIEGAAGYELKHTISGGNTETIIINGGSRSSYQDNSAINTTFRIRAFYDVDRTKYDDTGSFRVYNQYATASVSDDVGTVLVTVRDADTNAVLSGVRVYLDNTYVGTTSGGSYAVSVSADTTHTIRTEKTGYLSVEYREITVEGGETISLDTLMQVPFNADAPTGNASLTIKDAQTGNVMPNVAFVIRKGMNTTTGTALTTAISNANGVVSLTGLDAGNYTGVIDETGYIKTVFNFTVIGGRSKSYEVHVSPILSGQQIRFVLSWGANPRDLDSHITGNNIHVYYRTPVAQGINLDVDDVDGYGPETVTVNLGVAPEGTYSYYVHRYAGSGTIRNSGATVKVYRGSTLIKRYSAEQAESGDIWRVCTVNTRTGVVADW